VVRVIDFQIAGSSPALL